jgi:hypothetical protein
LASRKRLSTRRTRTDEGGAPKTQRAVREAQRAKLKGRDKAQGARLEWTRGLAATHIGAPVSDPARLVECPSCSALETVTRTGPQHRWNPIEPLGVRETPAHFVRSEIRAGSETGAPNFSALVAPRAGGLLPPRCGRNRWK